MEYLKQYLNQTDGLYAFSGRLSRSGFFIGQLLLMIFISMVTVPIAYFLAIYAPQLVVDAGKSLPIWVGLIVAIYVFVYLNVFVINVAAMARRFRDAHVSFYNFFWMLLPFIGSAVLFCQLMRRPVEVQND